MPSHVSAGLVSGKSNSIPFLLESVGPSSIRRVVAWHEPSARGRVSGDPEISVFSVSSCSSGSSELDIIDRGGVEKSSVKVPLCPG